jgi:hypothetical protein
MAGIEGGTMKQVSALTLSLAAGASVHQEALNTIQNLNTPHKNHEDIKRITELYRSKPPTVGDGKDWARQIMIDQHKFHPMAIKWAKEILNGGVK